MKFDPDKDIPDLQGKVILVTGGNIGLGFESILQLSKHNPSTIYLAARNKEKAETAIQKLKSLSPSSSTTEIKFLELDLTSFDSIKKSASEFRSQSSRLDILMLNAGIMAHPPGLTKEGYEIQFGTNHVGHALFTRLLMPTLLHTAQLTPNADRDVRVVTLSSSAHNFAPKPQGYFFDQLKTDMKNTSTWTRYGQSKLANIHFSRSLAELHPELKCVSLHPGSVATNLVSGVKESYPLFKSLVGLISPLIQTPVAKGALGQLWASTGEGVETGVFYYPVALKGKDSALAKDEELRKKLWDWTEKELAPHVTE